MTIAGAHITQGGGTALTSGPTDISWTPVAGRLYIAAVFSRLGAGAGTPVTPTLSGNGLTWVQAGAPITVFDASSTVTQKLTLFRAMGPSPTAGFTTMSFGAQSQTRAYIFIEEFQDAQGTDGSTSIVQQVSLAQTAQTTNGGTTLAAFADAINNAAYFAIVHTAAQVTNPKSGWAELWDQSANAIGCQTQWRLSGSDLSPSATWATASCWCCIALEIKKNVNALAPVEMVHPRGIGGTKVSASLVLAAIVHARAMGTPITFALSLKPSSLVHVRVLTTGTRLSTTLKPLSIVHTRALTAPRITLNVTPSASLVHARAIGSGVKLSPTIKPASLVHTRAISGAAITVIPGPPPIIPKRRSYGRYPRWEFDPRKVHN